MELRPVQVVAELDKHIVGQDDAKKAVALALRNRYRRMLLPKEAREEISPKNILMIGPTGVGKTEIARRLARLANAPFVKVEATKYTEVGYVGRDVESMVRDLVESAIRMVREEHRETVMPEARRRAEESILDIFVPSRRKPQSNPFQTLFGENREQVEPQLDDGGELRKRFQERLLRGELENHPIDIEVTDRPNPTDMFMGSGMEELGANVSDMLAQFMPKRTKKKRVTVAQARRSLAQDEAEKLLDNEDIASRGIELAEQNGIIFIDEIDKVATKSGMHGPDVSREGVQRDILPIVEGSTVNTKYGPVRTDFVLFIAAGAFHMSKPSDLIPELQGRFPVRVELKSLRREDLRRILTEPRTSLLKQYQALFSTEGVSLDFSECAVKAIAHAAFNINSQGQDIGARRLHTILERVLEEYSFEAGTGEKTSYTIDGAYVQSKLEPLLGSADLGKYIL